MPAHKGKKKNKNCLGWALMKQMNSKRNSKHVDPVHPTVNVVDEREQRSINLQSVTEETSLEEFIRRAELEQTNFEAVKSHFKIIKPDPIIIKDGTSQPNFDQPLTVPRRPKWDPSVSKQEQLERERLAFVNWCRQLSELKSKLDAALTPYEKNIELWKQLWRTLEKSDIVLIVLDARNPLLLRSIDLEKYALEQNCKCVLLLNKADLTTEYERKCWAKYFSEQNVPVIFSSAVVDSKDSQEQSDSDTNSVDSEYDDTDSGNPEYEETESADEEHNLTKDKQALHNAHLASADLECEKEYAVKNEESSKSLKSHNPKCESENENENVTYLKSLPTCDTEIENAHDNPLKDTKKHVELHPEKEESSQLTNSTVSDSYKMEEKLQNMIEGKKAAVEAQNNVEENKDKTMEQKTDNILMNSHDICNREKLVSYLKGMTVNYLKNPPRLTVGMIGYPNVGKSSTINSLVKGKKVSVSAMPGHTRHVQTLVLEEDDIMLLDCPGLVLPAYAVAPDLLLTAVLPIDQMRSHDAAMARLCQLVPRDAFAAQYGLLLPPADPAVPLYRQILQTHALNRGFMSGRGLPWEARSARDLLKDAAGGRLHWAQLPAGCPPEPRAARPAPPAHHSAAAGHKARPATRQQMKLVEGWNTHETLHSFVAFERGKYKKGPLQVMEEQKNKPKKKYEKPLRCKHRKLRKMFSHLDE